MEGVRNIASQEADSTWVPVEAITLAAVVAIILSGAPYLLSLFHRSFAWILWIAMIWSIYRFSKELPLWRLIRPALPYLLWLVFYLTWALIVAPTTNIAFAGKTAITTTILAIAMAILTAKPRYLQMLANFAQFAMAANLALWFIMNWSPKVARLVMEASDPRFPEPFLAADRFGALYGNANMLGYVCLVTTILSVLSVPWIAWLGRLSCLPLLYLTASRKSSILYLLILVLYVVIVQRRNMKFWVASAAVVFSLTSVLLLSDRLVGGTRAAAHDSKVSRLLDVQEKTTREMGGQTRVDLLHHWISSLREAPWYGYGLQTMAGTVYDEAHPGKVAVKGPYPVGAHNTYLGVWIEIGPVGFITFALMLLHYVRLCLFAGTDPISRWVLISFMLVNLTFLFVSHSHLFCFEGKIAFTLFFLLPSSLGLRQLGRRQVESK